MREISIHANHTNTRTLFSLLEEQGVLLPHPCNKQGTCGKCQVMTSTDGWQLACSYIPKENTIVTLDDTTKRSDINVVDYYQTPQLNLNSPTLFIDLGTTTISMVLLDTNGDMIYRRNFANPSTSYGTDVIARMKSSCEGHRHDIKTQLASCFREQWTYFPHTHIEDCYLAGNVVMIHLLMGYPCDTLAVAPFRPFKNEFLNINTGDCNVHILPGISPFVGGDITAGLWSLYFDRRNDTCLFLDLGTNGELALLQQGHITVSSVAAGPAFEGGNLSCGCQGIPGAITNVQFGGLSPKLTTIDNKLPVGLCGTGALNLVSSLLHHGYVTSSGMIEDSFPAEGLPLARIPHGGNIIFTREDFRQVQLALGSVRAGIRTLLHHCQVDWTELDHVYLAGGFGYELPLETIISLQLLNPTVANKVSSIGNSCLTGLMRYAADSDNLSALLDKSSELMLAEDPYYKDQLIRCLSWEECDT